MTYGIDLEILPFMAGFTVAGRRRDDGKLQSYIVEGALLDDWPEEVKLFGNTYTLEGINRGVDGYESGEYA